VTRVSKYMSGRKPRDVVYHWRFNKYLLFALLFLWLYWDLHKLQTVAGPAGPAGEDGPPGAPGPSGSFDGHLPALEWVLTVLGQEPLNKASWNFTSQEWVDKMHSPSTLFLNASNTTVGTLASSYDAMRRRLTASNTNFLVNGNVRIEGGLDTYGQTNSYGAVDFWPGVTFGGTEHGTHHHSKRHFSIRNGKFVQDGNECTCKV